MKAVVRALAAILFGVFIGALFLVTAPRANAEVSGGLVDARSDRTTVSFTVNGGCDSSPTVGLRVTLPTDSAVISSQEPPGWHREDAGDEIRWIGSALPSDQPAFFAVSLTLVADVAARVSFPTVQTCQDGELAWTDAVDEGQPKAQHPAPIVVFNPTDGSDQGNGTSQDGAGADAAAGSPGSAVAESGEGDVDNPWQLSLVADLAVLFSAVGTFTVLRRRNLPIRQLAKQTTSAESAWLLP